MQEDLKKKLLDLIKDNPELKIEFLFREWETDFLRFFNSQTNYNISKKSIILDVTVCKGKKSLSFSISNPTLEAIEEKFTESLGIIDSVPEDPFFVDLEKDQRKTEELVKKNNIELLNLEQKIKILKEISEAVKPYKFNIYGTFICNYVISHLINSNGLDKTYYNSPIYFEIKAVSEVNQVTVLESFGSEDASKLNIKNIINSLSEKVKLASTEVVDVEPGEYEVILAPRCIGEYLAYYVGSSMTASSLDRKNTLLEGKLNEKIFPEHITLIDDPKDPFIVNFDYNSEGHLYATTPLIEKGVFKNFLVNNYYSYKTKLEENGAEASCLVMSTGDATLEEMVKSIKNGIYISSLHYMNFINVKESSITGLTRDGSFLIKDGKVTNIMNNLRFTVKISDIISNITQIENKSYTFAMSENYGEFSINAFRMPHVKVKNFKISSSTKTV